MGQRVPQPGVSNLTLEAQADLMAMHARWLAMMQQAEEQREFDEAVALWLLQRKMGRTDA